MAGVAQAPCPLLASVWGLTNGRHQETGGPLTLCLQSLQA